MKAKVAAPVLAPPDMAAVSAAVCLSRAAPICSASPPAVPCDGKRKNLASHSKLGPEVSAGSDVEMRNNEQCTEAAPFSAASFQQL